MAAAWAYAGRDSLRVFAELAEPAKQRGFEFGRREHGRLVHKRWLA